jgi:saccharopine dehydrogenase (NAD+, L-lysine-forming)
MSLRIGIIREGKVPPDSRVALTPVQCAAIVKNHPQVEIFVQPSPGRCFSDYEYDKRGIPLQEDLSHCDVLLGVKEVPVHMLIPNKTYFFFSHTIKKQAYNRALLQDILKKNIRLIDYEVLTNERGQRVIAFGKFAGMVGAHNGIMTYGKRTGLYSLKRMKDCLDYAEAKMLYQQMKWPAMRIVLTGTGRVGQGAAMVLRDMGIKEVTPEDYLSNTYEEAVFTQLECNHYVARKNGAAYDKQHFYAHPEDFKSIFGPYTLRSDIMINGIYWDNNAPAFFSREDMQSDAFSIQVIADVTCDIAPVSSIPSTLKASTIADPIFGYDPQTGQETTAHQATAVDMMTIDNLPNELPRDASKAFGGQFIKHVLPELSVPESAFIEKATITTDGQLGPHFTYLQNYVDGLE